MKHTILSVLVSLLLGSETYAQIPVEVFGGHEKTTLDIMFFNYFKNKEGENSTFLFFNRNRASIDYQQSSTANLPSFGFTEAVSFNHPRLKGVAPVAVVQFFNSGVFPKAGVQYFHRKGEFTFFSWLVCETTSNPYIDFFMLSRFEPKLSDRLNLFMQAELVNAFPTLPNANQTYIQRIRVGLKANNWQVGVGSDFNQSGVDSFTTTNNVGGFIRHEFK